MPVHTAAAAAVLVLGIFSSCSAGSPGGLQSTTRDTARVAPSEDEAAATAWESAGSGVLYGIRWRAYSTSCDGSDRCAALEKDGRSSSGSGTSESLIAGLALGGKAAVCAGSKIKLFAPVIGPSPKFDGGAIFFGLVSDSVIKVVVATPASSVRNEFIPLNRVIVGGLPGPATSVEIVEADGQSERCELTSAGPAIAALCSN